MMGRNTAGKGTLTVEKKQRIELIDALRGFAVLLMLMHHFIYDLVVFAGAPRWLFQNVFFHMLHYVSAGLFVVLSGVSSQFSGSNVKRGVKVLLCAAVITVVTVFMDMDIWFGVLHLLGVCMVLYGLSRPVWEKIPSWLVLTMSVAGLLATWHMEYGILTDKPYLWMFGFVTDTFYSSDYFPLLPWGFVFLFGIWLGRYVKAGKLPQWFYTVRAPRLAAVGRQSLKIYMLHQPVVYAVAVGFGFLLKL